MAHECLKTELAVSALQVEYPAPKNVVITIEFTTHTTWVFCVSLALLFMYVLGIRLVVLFADLPALQELEDSLNGDKKNIQKSLVKLRSYSM